MEEYFRKNFGDWYQPLERLLHSVEFYNLGVKIQKYYNNSTIYPAKKDLFRAFQLCSYKDVKVIILGQDPYYTCNEKGIPDATGLAFGVDNEASSINGSLVNIYKEIEAEYNGFPIVDPDYSLESWAKQGVLLLNTALTVEKGSAGSHLEMWRFFTEGVIKHLVENKELIWMLWGNKAQAYGRLIPTDYLDNHRQVIIDAVHPSPLSAYKGFFGSNCFKICNSHLLMSEKQPIHWFKAYPEAIKRNLIHENVHKETP